MGGEAEEGLSHVWVLKSQWANQASGIESNS